MGLRRSLLYVPASNPRAIDKARSLKCDCVILDLEDSVLPSAKNSARERAVRTVSEGGFGNRELIVRVNGLDTPWGQSDLSAMVKTELNAILVPKVNSGNDVVRYNQALAASPVDLRLWAMIETARCVFRLDDIASQSARTRLACLVVGTNDLGKEMCVSPTVDRVPLQPILTLSVAAARIHGVAIVDGVYNQISDYDGFEAQCRQALAFGFVGKTLIHPGQIEPANRIFTPTDEQLREARAIVEAFARTENQDKGVIQLNGRLVERLHLEQANSLLQDAPCKAWD